MSEVPLGKQIDKLAKLRKDKADLDAKLKDVEGQISTLKGEILASLQSSGMQKASSKTLTVSIKQDVMPEVTDWDAFYTFIKKSNSFHLLQRRVSTLAWRELHEQLAAKKKEVPGTAPFVKVDLSITTLKQS